MPLKIIRNDLTKVKADAIVNAANSALTPGGGVCGAIFTAAGREALAEECAQLGGCRPGEAVITNGHALPAKYIIHTVGPIWHGGGQGEAATLAACYTASLKLAVKHGCRSVAFPLIASGVYGYPKEAALSVAIAAIGDFLMKHELTVFLVVYDKKAYVLSEKLFTDIRSYIDEHYVEEHFQDRPRRLLEPFEAAELRQASYDLADETVCASVPAPRHLEDVVKQLDESFSQRLLRLIAEKGRTEVETYKRANIDRKLFSKIRKDAHYTPAKITAVALAVALELNLDETKDLLARAGFTLSHSRKFDLIIEYFIREGQYNIFEINEALFAFDQPLLGV
jgi:O-acetyl-ADP-ribose deacetylase (regulator of RNase III)